MSNYTVTTNFLAKDSLVSGNPLKLVKGADLTTEFNNLATAIATKFDGSVVFSPDGTAAQPSYGFTNNAGTGMYNVAGVLGLATGGVARLTISATGVAAFSSTVSINGATGGQLQMTPIGAGGAVQSVLQVFTDNNTYLDAPTSGTPTGGKINFRVGAGLAAAMTLDASANVNIPNGTGSLSPVYAGIPQNFQSGSTYPVVLSDANKHIFGNFSGTKTFTLPANSSIAFPIGTAITFVAGNGVMNIAITTDLMILAGTASTGTRALASNGVATAIKITSTIWIISGTGLT